jgi:hypothetical protein
MTTTTAATAGSARRSAVTALTMLAVTRLPVLLIGAVAVLIVGTIPPPNSSALWRVSPNEVANLLARWDTFWYHSIAVGGYHWDPAAFRHQNIVFFPLYPLLMRWIGLAIGGHPMIAGLAVSLLSFTAAIAILYRLAALDLGESTARTAVLLISTFPFALYYSAVYTESLFLFLSAAAFYACRREQFVWASLAGLAAGLTRPNGCWLAISLFIVVFTSAREDKPRIVSRRTVIACAVALAPIVGMATYSAYLFFRFGDPLAWMHGQAAWGIPLAGKPHAIEPGEFGNVDATPTDVLTWILNIAVFIAALVGALPIWRRFGAAYTSFVLLTLVPPVATHLFMSSGRFAAPLFPLFFWLASVIPVKQVPRVVAAFAAGQAVLAVLFFLWRPVL